MAKRQQKSTSNYIKLGYPLDLLLNRDCKSEHYNSTLQKLLRKETNENSSFILYPDSSGKNVSGKQRAQSEGGGIELPLHSSENSEDFSLPSGNILIKGSPGSGKSTLALQIAAMATDPINDYCVMYFALEENPNAIIAKAKNFGWHKKIKIFRQILSINQNAGDEDIAEALKRSINHSEYNNCFHCKSANENLSECDFCKHPAEPDKRISKVFLPLLSQRDLIPDGEKLTLFDLRYKELEILLRAGHKINRDSINNKKCPRLGLVCIDSLSVLGQEKLSREQIFRIFKLFKRYKIQGIFLSECNSNLDPAGGIDDLESLADVVINLSATQDKDYYLRYFEISKSRYKHQIYGKHPFRIRNMKANNKPVFWIFPSLHFISSAQIMESTQENGKSMNGSDKSHYGADNFFGLNKFSKVSALDTYNNESLLLEGPPGTFKSRIGFNFLMQGLIDDEDVILITFQNSSYINKLEDAKNGSQYLLSDYTIKKYKEKSKIKEERSEIFEEDVISFWNCFLNQSKIKMEKLNTTNLNIIINQVKFKGPGRKKSTLTELTFKSGNLLAEEFIFNLIAVVQSLKKQSKRVAIFNIGLIGVEYPFLKSSKSSGELFIPVFLNILNNLNIPILITGTTGNCTEEDEIVAKTRATVDYSFQTNHCDIFGDSYVTLSGEGLISGQKQNPHYGEQIPLVIEPVRNMHKYRFKTDHVLLEGLVGFRTGKIERSGLSMHLFYETNAQKNYNKDIESMLINALGYKGITDNGHTGINVSNIEVGYATVLHDSLKVLSGKPLQKTLIYSLDEFFRKTPNIEKYLIPFGTSNDDKFCKRYINDVLIIAIKPELISKKEEPFSWQSLLNIATKESIKIKIAPEKDHNETLGCLLLDTIMAEGITPSNFSELFNDGNENQKNRIWKNILALFEICKKDNDFANILTSVYTQDNRTTEIKNKKMNFDIYIGWYNILREIVLQNHEELSQLKVFSLPGKGFSGNWYLGMVKGSVSETLGQSVIEILCSKKEEYKRYIHSVGLPFDEDYFTKNNQPNSNYKAWLRGEELLKSVLEINRKAHKRSDIKGYELFRLTLPTLFAQVYGHWHKIHTRFDESQRGFDPEFSSLKPRFFSVLHDRYNKAKTEYENEVRANKLL